MKSTNFGKGSTHCQSNYRDARKLCLQNTKILVIWTKIMSPLATTVCLLFSQNIPYIKHKPIITLVLEPVNKGERNPRKKQEHIKKHRPYPY